MSKRLGLQSRSIAIAALAMFSGLVAPALAAALPRIASMNVCTDQLLIPLADPEQILGLSRYSRDRLESWAADDAHRYRIPSGGAQDILVLRPDVLAASLFDKRSTRELLKQKGLRLAEFAVPRNLEEVKAQIRRMGEIVQHPDRAAAEIARLDAAIARARRVVVEKHTSVLPLSRRGWVSGRDSLVSSLLAETGLNNAASDLGVGTGGLSPLETV